eukprot:gene9584-6739_t
MIYTLYLIFNFTEFIHCNSLLEDSTTTHFRRNGITILKIKIKLTIIRLTLWFGHYLNNNDDNNNNNSSNNNKNNINNNTLDAFNSWQSLVCKSNQLMVTDFRDQRKKGIIKKKHCTKYCTNMNILCFLIFILCAAAPTEYIRYIQYLLNILILFIKSKLLFDNKKMKKMQFTIIIGNTITISTNTIIVKVV